MSYGCFDRAPYLASTPVARWSLHGRLHPHSSHGVDAFPHGKGLQLHETDLGKTDEVP
jgi:hypothetical protein